MPIAHLGLATFFVTVGVKLGLLKDSEFLLTSKSLGFLQIVM